MKVKLWRVPEGGTEYETVAVLTVRGDGYELDDPFGLVPTDLAVLVEDGEQGLRRVGLDEDPQIWARNLHTLLRTGYLVPVVVEDAADR